MRRVLVLSYHFPPIGGAGAQRPAKLVRRLDELGWEATVVTCAPVFESRWTPHDAGLLDELPESTHVLRVPGPEPAPNLGWRGRAERWLDIEPWRRWWVEGVVETAHEAADFDLVYAWMAPFETAEAADRIARERGVPWVGDLGDPWALDEMVVYATGLHRRRALARMRERLGRADALVLSTAEAAAQMRAHVPGLAGKRVVSIPNGFDADDFAGPPPVRDDAAFRIVHTGYLHTELGLRHRRTRRVRELLGGATPGLDILTRSHVFLLQAIDRLVAEDPSLASVLEVHLAGVLSPTDRAAAEGSPVVRMHGYLQHDETVQLLRSADLLFLPMHNLPAGHRARIVPGKTYEYLGADRPILAAVPEGDARDILAASGCARVCRPGDVDGLAAALRAELGRFRSGSPESRPSAAIVDRFEYARLARELSELFEAVVGGVAVAA